MSEHRTADLEQALRVKQQIIRAASGQEPAELVLKNAAYVNVFSRAVCHGDIAITAGQVVGIGSYSGKQEVDLSEKVVLPGFLDAHIHLESSLVSPVEFVKAILPHGTTTVVTDPHEIANVMGTDGIQYMLESTEGLPVDVQFMLPSCVPATPMDESGAVLNWDDIQPFYAHPRVRGLAEMMNFVGVVNGDEAVLRKLTAAQALNKVIDGHAPDLEVNQLNAYTAAGIRSDHECHDLHDAQLKLERGQFIMIREGTAARNLEALVPLLSGKGADRCLLCTDDKHPNDLLEKGHIDYMIKKAVSLGADPIAAVAAASLNGARYFGLNDRGAIAPGYAADLVVVDDLRNFNVLQVYCKGRLAAENGKALDFSAPAVSAQLVDHAHHTFNVAPLSPEDFADNRPHGVITMVPKEITTLDGGMAECADPAQDLLKIAVIERHRGTQHIGIGYLKGYGLRSGAIATSIAHDSHNLIVVGATDADMAAAANRIVELNGGIVVLDQNRPLAQVPLSIGGIMSDETLETVNEKLESAKASAFDLGVSREIDPFMTLSFMALPVIPSLRITTKGIFDAAHWRFLDD